MTLKIINLFSISLHSYHFLCVCEAGGRVCVVRTPKIYLLSKLQVYTIVLLTVGHCCTLNLQNFFTLPNWNFAPFDHHLPIYTLSLSPVSSVLWEASNFGLYQAVPFILWLLIEFAQWKALAWNQRVAEEKSCQLKGLTSSFWLSLTHQVRGIISTRL